MNVQQCQKCDLITSKHDIAPIPNSHWIKNEVVLVKDELLVACAFWTVLRYLGMHVPRVTFRSNPVSQSHAHIHICTRMYTLPLRRDWPFHGFMSLACVNQSCGIFFFFSQSASLDNRATVWTRRSLEWEGYFTLLLEHFWSVSWSRLSCFSHTVENRPTF